MSTYGENIPENLWAEYSTEAFNSLPNTRDISKLIDPRDPHDPFVAKFTNALVPIFLEAQVTDLAAISLLHKHFYLKEGERVMENLEGNYSVMRPERSYEDDSVTPYLWRVEVDEAGSPLWRPLEFVRACDSAVTLYQRLFSNKAFLYALGREMLDTGLNNHLGLILLHRTHIEMPVETTHAKSRTQTLTPAIDVPELPKDRDDRLRKITEFLQSGALVRSMYKIDPNISDDYAAMMVCSSTCGACACCGWYH